MTARFCKAGDIGYTNGGCQYRVIEYVGNCKYLIEFQDEFKHRLIARGGRLQEGKIANPYFRGFNKQGYIGFGKYNSNPVENPAYLKWACIWRRIGQYDDPRYVSYVECTVDVRWESLQDFSEFYHNCPYRQEGWELDKDIITPGNKVYGPDTAAYVPKELNVFFTNKGKKTSMPVGVRENKRSFSAIVSLDGVTLTSGGHKTPEAAYVVYKEYKEKEALRLSDKYDGLVDPRVIKALRNFKVDNYAK